MGREIERKFLVVTSALPDLGGVRCARFWQGYLSFSPSVRLRIADASTPAARAWLTIKGPGSVARDEFEYAVPVADAEGMKPLAHASLDKTRYFIEHGGAEWEVDEFHGAHEGLWLAELELSSEDAPFDRPPWLGDEVSADGRYTNGALARSGHPPRR